MKFISGFFMAWGYFTIIPCPCKRWDESARGFMLLSLPLIGLAIGGLWLALWRLLAFAGAPVLLAAALISLAPQAFSGFIHTDGYMDCCDAIFSRRPQAEKQRILKDSNVGAFAVIGLGALLLISFSAMAGILLDSATASALTGDADGFRYSLGGLNENCLAMLFLSIPVVSRFMSAVCVHFLRPIGHSQYREYGRYREQRELGGGRRVLLPLAAAAITAAIILAASLLLKAGDAAVYITLLAELIAYLAACFYARKQLGGMSGDISGFAITVSEVAAIVCLALL